MSEFIEKLADKEHESWSRWMQYLFSKCSLSKDVLVHSADFVIPKELVSRWVRQANTSYENLSEQEKQSDRNEVAHILPIINERIEKLEAALEFYAAASEYEWEDIILADEGKTAKEALRK